MTESISTSSKRLVSAMEQTLKRPLAPAVREAFLRVPRHQFVPAYYDQGQRFTAPAPTDEATWETWCMTIAQDEALTTQVDAQGLPTSSSSQPSVMAVMLEQLALQPGQRVLEVGTGTGYNAALVAVLVRNPSLVTTVDIDPILVDQARERIEQVVGPGMQVVVGNALEEKTLDTRYDRLIATGSTLPIPHTWITHLNPGGRLIVDLRGRISGGLLLVQAHDEQRFSGRFLVEARGISFMRLRAAVDDPVRPPFPREGRHLPVRERFSLTPNDAAYECADHFLTYEHFHSQDDTFNDWLQWAFPTLSIVWKGQKDAPHPLLLETSTQTHVTLEPQEHGMTIVVKGTRSLWSEIVQVYHDWLRAGRPGNQNATWNLDAQGRQSIRITHDGQIGIFPLE